jgi:Ring finger domain
MLGQQGVLSAVILSSLLSFVTKVHGSVYVDTPFAQNVYDSVPYFDFATTKWPFMKKSGDMLVGSIRVLTGSDFDTFFMTYQTAQNESTTPPETAGAIDVGEVDTDFEAESFSSLDDNSFVSAAPSFLLVEFGGSKYASSITNIAQVAEWLAMDFVVLVVNRNVSWDDKIRFWWNHEIPGVSGDVIAREIGERTSGVPCGFLAVGPVEGINLLARLEEYESWAFEPPQFYFGIDDLATMAGRTLMWRVSLYLICTGALCRWIRIMDRRERRIKGEEELVAYTGEELGMGEVQTTETHECCICLESLQQGEMVRTLPCRHVFHHDCINGWFNHHKYSCPMCKVDLKKHLEERRVATEEISMLSPPPDGSFLQRLWPWQRTIQAVSIGQLIDERIDGHDSALGDLELSVDQGTGVIV